MGVARYTQSSQNNKFAISLQYFKKEVRDKLDFLHEDKHQSFPQANSIFFLPVIASHAQSNQNGKFVIFLQYLSKKEGSDEVDFCMHVNINFSEN